MRTLLNILAAVLFSVAARAEWTVHSAELEMGRNGVEHQHLLVENASSEGRATVDLAEFSTNSCRMRLLDNPSGVSLAEMALREKAIAGVNGGYFDADFAPIGLRVSKGKTIAPFRRARLLSGVMISSGQSLRILRLSEFSLHRKFDVAVQCGPFLVDAAKAVRGLDDSRLARRTFAALLPDNHAVLGICSDMSLAQLAEILVLLKMNRAINLDGGSSTAFSFLRENGTTFSIGEQKQVRDFLGVSPRL
jgi:hypothetical protein